MCVSGMLQTPAVKVKDFLQKSKPFFINQPHYKSYPLFPIAKANRRLREP